MKRAYGWDPVAAQSGLWGTEPLWQAEASPQSPSLSAAGTSYHHVHTDHLATPMVATDKTGVQTWKVISEAFGQMRVDNASAITMNLRLPGQYFDGESGGHYNYHRDYRAELGRYLQSDPIGIDGGINTFSYVEGNPISFTDPDGLRPNAGGSARQRRQDRREQAREAQAEAIRVQNYLQRKAEQDAWVRNFTRRNEEWGQYGDGFGTLTGGGIAGRHPSVPNSLETLLDPRREGPYVPDLRGNTCPAITQGR